MKIHGKTSPCSTSCMIVINCHQNTAELAAIEDFLIGHAQPQAESYLHRYPSPIQAVTCAVTQQKLKLGGIKVLRNSGCASFSWCINQIQRFGRSYANLISPLQELFWLHPRNNARKTGGTKKIFKGSNRYVCTRTILANAIRVFNVSTKKSKS